MSRRELKRDGLVISLLVLVIIFSSACTIRKISKNEGKEGDIYSTWNKTGTGFNAEEYVNANWDSKIVPAFLNDSTSISDVIQSIMKDPDTAIEKFGYRKDTDSTEIFFKVKGQGQVLIFNDSSRVGLLEVDIKPEDGIADLSLQVGPVVKRTEIRDSLSFIKFTDVGNQLQFASLSDELNKSVLDLTLKGINLADTVGQTIEFYGVFSVESGAADMKNVVITPVILRIVK